MTDKSFEDDFNDMMSADAPAEPEAPEPAQEANQDAEAMADAPAPEPAAPPPADPDKPPTFEDLLAALPAEQAARFKPLVENAGREMHRLRSDSGRVSALQHLYHESKAKADAEASRAEQAEARARELEARSTQPMTRAEQAQHNEEVDAFAKEFPEFSEAVNLRFDALLKKHLGQQPTPQGPAPQEPDARQQAPQNQDRNEVETLAVEYAALDAAHPDWQQAIESRVYQSWKNAQGPAVQRLIDSDYADDAVRVLDRFKSDLALARRRQEGDRKATNQQRLAQHVGAKGAPPRPTSVPDDFESAFNYYVKKG